MTIIPEGIDTGQVQCTPCTCNGGIHVRVYVYIYIYIYTCTCTCILFNLYICFFLLLSHALPLQNLHSHFDSSLKYASSPKKALLLIGCRPALLLAKF